MATTKATTLGHRTIPTSAITSGTFADGRIAVSNVTQHEGSIDALASNPTVTLGSNTTFGSGVSLANATFPAGHVIQVVTANSNTEASGTGSITAVSKIISMSSSSNKLYAFGMLSWELTINSRSQVFGGAKIVTSGSGVTAETFKPTPSDTTGETGIRLSTPTTSSSWKIGGLLPVNFMFSPAYAGNVTVTLYGMGYDSNYGVMEVNRNDSTHGHSNLILMEVVA